MPITTYSPAENLTAPPGELSAPNSGTPDPQEVARRAYERFQLRGGEYGHDQDDWFEAEREIAEWPRDQVSLSLVRQCGKRPESASVTRSGTNEPLLVKVRSASEE